MTRMKRLIRIAPRSESLIHIYPGRVVLNRWTCKLLELNEDSRVDFYFDEDAAQCGRTAIYICKVPYGGYGLVFRGSTARVNATPLARKLATCLSGEGTYRVCPEVIVKDNGLIYYNIFYRYD